MMYCHKRAGRGLALFVYTGKMPAFTFFSAFDIMKLYKIGG